MFTHRLRWGRAKCVDNDVIQCRTAQSSFSVLANRVPNLDAQVNASTYLQAKSINNFQDAKRLQNCYSLKLRILLILQGLLFPTYQNSYFLNSSALPEAESVFFPPLETKRKILTVLSSCISFMSEGFLQEDSHIINSVTHNVCSGLAAHKQKHYTRAA